MECYEARETHSGWAASVCVHRLEEGYKCVLCERYGERFVKTYYQPDSIGVMENTIHALKEECNKLEARCEVLENHIKYAPGGEGAFKAMCSFYKLAETEPAK